MKSALKAKKSKKAIFDIKGLISRYPIRNGDSILFLVIAYMIENYGFKVEVGKSKDKKLSHINKICIFIKSLKETNSLSPLAICDKIFLENIYVDSNLGVVEETDSNVLYIGKDAIKETRGILMEINKTYQKNQTISKRMESLLIESVEFTINSCVDFFISYMTVNEKWIKSKYKIEYQQIINPALDEIVVSEE